MVLQGSNSAVVVRERQEVRRQLLLRVYST